MLKSLVLLCLASVPGVFSFSPRSTTRSTSQNRGVIVARDLSSGVISDEMVRNVVFGGTGISALLVVASNVVRAKKDEMGLSPTQKQKEQLEKFGPTPETSIEMFFDKLEATDENDPTMKEFLGKPGGDQWKELITNLKESKKKKDADDNTKKDSSAFPPEALV